MEETGPRDSKTQENSFGEAIAALRAGKPILLYDADGREEETDIVELPNMPDNVALLLSMEQT